jgi:putative ABC transport system ATP-binding protein
VIALEAVQVTFARGSPLETRALRRLDLTLDEGSFTTVIGSNGAGKSTLLNLLSGDVRPDTGRILFDGREVSRWSATRRAALVSRVFQDPLTGTCEALSVEENMALAAQRGRRRGLRRALAPERCEQFRTALERLGLGLEDRLQDPVGQLSGGQRQALCLVMATLADTRILLLDEHTAALDPRTSALVLELTRRLVCELGLTTLMVTHSMRQALECGERTLMLHEGRVVLDVGGDTRRGLTVADLIQMFSRVRGAELAEDSLLLD